MDGLFVSVISSSLSRKSRKRMKYNSSKPSLITGCIIELQGIETRQDSAIPRRGCDRHLPHVSRHS